MASFRMSPCSLAMGLIPSAELNVSLSPAHDKKSLLINTLRDRVYALTHSSLTCNHAMPIANISYSHTNLVSP